MFCDGPDSREKSVPSLSSLNPSNTHNGGRAHDDRRSASRLLEGGKRRARVSRRGAFANKPTNRGRAGPPRRWAGPTRPPGRRCPPFPPPRTRIVAVRGRWGWLERGHGRQRAGKGTAHASAACFFSRALRLVGAFLQAHSPATHTHPARGSRRGRQPGASEGRHWGWKGGAKRGTQKKQKHRRCVRRERGSTPSQFFTPVKKKKKTQPPPHPLQNHHGRHSSRA